jgi:NDP-sugar pyrophosphorylase family protein
MTTRARLPVAILAGGLATRLRPLTDRVPKSLVEVAGRPFIAHQLALLAAAGVREVVVLVGHLGERIEAAIDEIARRADCGFVTRTMVPSRAARRRAEASASSRR